MGNNDASYNDNQPSDVKIQDVSIATHNLRSLFVNSLIYNRFKGNDRNVLKRLLSENLNNLNVKTKKNYPLLSRINDIKLNSLVELDNRDSSRYRMVLVHTNDSPVKTIEKLVSELKEKFQEKKDLTLFRIIFLLEVLAQCGFDTIFTTDFQQRDTLTNFDKGKLNKFMQEIRGRQYENTSYSLENKETFSSNLNESSPGNRSVAELVQIVLRNPDEYPGYFKIINSMNSTANLNNNRITRLVTQIRKFDRRSMDLRIFHDKINQNNNIIGAIRNAYNKGLHTSIDFVNRNTNSLMPAVDKLFHAIKKKPYMQHKILDQIKIKPDKINDLEQKKLFWVVLYYMNLHMDDSCVKFYDMDTWLDKCKKVENWINNQLQYDTPEKAADVFRGRFLKGDQRASVVFHYSVIEYKKLNAIVEVSFGDSQNIYSSYMNNTLTIKQKDYIKRIINFVKDSELLKKISRLKLFHYGQDALATHLDFLLSIVEYVKKFTSEKNKYNKKAISLQSHKNNINKVITDKRVSVENIPKDYKELENDIIKKARVFESRNKDLKRKIKYDILRKYDLLPKIHNGSYKQFVERRVILQKLATLLKYRDNEYSTKSKDMALIIKMKNIQRNLIHIKTDNSPRQDIAILQMLVKTGGPLAFVNKLKEAFYIINLHLQHDHLIKRYVDMNVEYRTAFLQLHSDNMRYLKFRKILSTLYKTTNIESFNLETVSKSIFNADKDILQDKVIPILNKLSKHFSKFHNKHQFKYVYDLKHAIQSKLASKTTKRLVPVPNYRQIADRIRGKLGTLYTLERSNMPAAYTYYHFNYDVIGGNNYAITHKIDGLRVTLDLDRQNVFGSAIRIRGGEWQSVTYKGTNRCLVDGELITLNRKKHIYIFECYFMDKHLLNSKLPERLAAIHFLNNTNIQNISNGEIYTLHIKKFKFIDDKNIYDEFAKSASDFINSKTGNNKYEIKYNEGKIQCDGLIIQPTASLTGPDSAVERKKCNDIECKIKHRPLKWKPSEFVTIDLAIKKDSDKYILHYNNEKNPKNNTIDVIRNSDDKLKRLSELVNEPLGFETMHVKQYIRNFTINDYISLQKDDVELFEKIKSLGGTPIAECMISKVNNQLKFNFVKFTNYLKRSNVLLEKKKPNYPIVVATTIAQWMVPITPYILRHYHPHENETEIRYGPFTPGDFDSKFNKVKHNILNQTTDKSLLSAISESSKFVISNVKLYEYTNDLFRKSALKHLPRFKVHDRRYKQYIIDDIEISDAYAYKSKHRVHSIDKIVTSVERHALLPKMLFKDPPSTKYTTKTRFSRTLGCVKNRRCTRIDITKYTPSDNTNDTKWVFEIELLNASNINTLKDIKKYLPNDFRNQLLNQ